MVIPSAERADPNRILRPDADHKGDAAADRLGIVRASGVSPTLRRASQHGWGRAARRAGATQFMYLDVGLAIFTAALGAAVAWGIRATAAKVEDARVRAKFPVAGTYISEYEDEIDGAVIVTKDTVVLSQKGTVVNGTSTNLADDRRFNLRGEIIGGQYLSGVYSDESPTIGGLGTFFMQPKVDREGVYEGIWAGWGAAQQRVVSGRYRWTPTVACSVRLLSTLDAHLLTRATAILGEGLGELYVSREELALAVESSDLTAAFGAFSEDGELIGVSTVNPLTDAAAERIRTAVEATGRRVPPISFHSVGVIQSSAVPLRARGRGVGTKMLEARLAYLRHHGRTLAIALAWDSGTEHASRGLLEAQGFHLHAVLPEYWREDSIERDYLCPLCEGQCSCTALLYSKTL